MARNLNAAAHLTRLGVTSHRAPAPQQRHAHPLPRRQNTGAQKNVDSDEKTLAPSVPRPLPQRTFRYGTRPWTRTGLPTRLHGCGCAATKSIQTDTGTGEYS